MLKYTLEERMALYEAFYGHRIPGSLAEKVKKPFLQMLNTFEKDLAFYHEDVSREKMIEALKIGLTALHRLGAKHPNLYLKVSMDESNAVQKAFNHADRFLLGKPLPLPPPTDPDEVWDAEQKAIEKKHKQIEVQREQYQPRELTEEEVNTGKQGFATLKEILASKPSVNAQQIKDA